MPRKVAELSLAFAIDAEAGHGTCRGVRAGEDDRNGGWLQPAIDQGLISTVLAAWIAFSDCSPRSSSFVTTHFRIEPRFVARRKAGKTRAGKRADHSLTEEGILHMELFMQECIEKTDAMLAVQRTVDADDATLIIGLAIVGHPIIDDPFPTLRISRREPHGCRRR